MLVKQSEQFLVQLLGGHFGLGVQYGGVSLSLEVVPVDGFNVPQLPEDELSVRAGNVKATHHRQVVRGECVGHQAGTNTAAAHFPCTAPSL